MPTPPMTGSPGGPDGPSGAALTVAAVARRLGLAPATLRTWDRRYGLGPTAHTAGAHRRYTPEDVARLQLARQLTLEGVSPAEAARVALATPRSEVHRAGARHGGGRVIALPDASPGARGLARAAMALDSDACRSMIAAALHAHGVAPAWQDLLVPVLRGIGERWEATGQGVDVEHLLSECAMNELRRHADAALEAGHPRNVRPVLLASAPEEGHSLPLHVVAAALAERQVSTRVLGARVPREALAAAVRRSGPAAVLVWSQLLATGDPAVLQALPALRPAPALLAAGPGWHEPLPAGATRVRDLPDAVRRVLEATVLGQDVG